MGTHPIFESDFDCLTEMNEQKTGPELAELRVKRRRREMRKTNENQIKGKKQKEKQHIEACLIGELKAAQSNSRNNKVKDKAYEAISAGRTETIENQPNARSALRLEALLSDPKEEKKFIRNKTRECKKIMNYEEQFKVHKIMSDDSWGQRSY